MTENDSENDMETELTEETVQKPTEDGELQNNSDELQATADFQSTGKTYNQITYTRLNFFASNPSNVAMKRFNHYAISEINRNYIGGMQEKTKLGSKNIFKIFTPFPLKSTLPLPVLDPWATSYQIVCGKDPANDLVRSRKYISQKILNIMKATRYTKKHKNDAATTRKKLKKIQERGSYHKSHTFPQIAGRLADIIDSDPDPYFKSNYNWYYTGGCVATASVEGRTILFTARGNDCDTLYCVPLKRTSLGPSGFRAVEAKAIDMQCEESEPIYQLNAVQHNDKVLVGVRQYADCKIYSCEKNPSSSLQQLYKTFSVGIPFTSLALSPWYAHKMCVLDKTKTLLLWDIQSRRSSSIKDVWNKSVDSDAQWCSVHYSYRNPDLLYVSDHNSVYSVDTKERLPDSSELINVKQLEKSLYACEVITAVASSVISTNLQYIGTTHHMFSVDIRKPGQPLQCWTHMMRGPPQYIGLCCDVRGREIINLGNSESSEIITLVNEWSDSNIDKYPVSRTQPYALNSLDDALSNAKLEGLCLNPLVQARMKLALTGLCCTSSESPAIFTSTGAGDVFCQRLSPRFAEHDAEEEKFAFNARMTFWQEKVKDADENKPSKPFCYDAFASRGKLLQQVVDKQIPTPNETENPVSKVLPSWLLTKAQLFQSNDDVQAARLLSAWGITDQKTFERMHLETFGLPVSSQAPTERVKEWLAANPDSQHAPDTQSTQHTQQLDSQESATDHISASQQPDQVRADGHISQPVQKPLSETGSDLILLTQKSLLKKSGSTKKKRRTDGF